MLDYYRFINSILFDIVLLYMIYCVDIFVGYFKYILKITKIGVQKY